MTPEAQRLADEFKRLMVDYCQAVLSCSDRATDQNVKAVVRAENATYAAIDRLASLIPAGGLAEEADCDARKDARRLDWCERHVVGIENTGSGGWMVFGDDTGDGKTLREAISAAMAASTPQGQEKTR